MIKITTRYVAATRIKDAQRIVSTNGSWHANCIWATGIASTEAMAAVQVAKCLSCSSKPMIAIKYSEGLEPPKFSLEYITSVKHEGKTLLEHNIRSYVSIAEAIKYSEGAK